MLNKLKLFLCKELKYTRQAIPLIINIEKSLQRCMLKNPLIHDEQFSIKLSQLSGWYYFVARDKDHIYTSHEQIKQLKEIWNELSDIEYKAGDSIILYEGEYKIDMGKRYKLECSRLFIGKNANLYLYFDKATTLIIKADEYEIKGNMQFKFKNK